MVERENANAKYGCTKFGERIWLVMRCCDAVGQPIIGFLHINENAG